MRAVVRELPLRTARGGIACVVAALLAAGCGSAHSGVRSIHVGAATPSKISAASGEGVHGGPAPVAVLRTVVALAKFPRQFPTWTVKPHAKVTLVLRGGAVPRRLTFEGWPGKMGTVPGALVPPHRTVLLTFSPPCPGAFMLMEKGNPDGLPFGVLSVVGVDHDST
jgi:hypothetical protein